MIGSCQCVLGFRELQYVARCCWPECTVDLSLIVVEEGQDGKCKLPALMTIIRAGNWIAREIEIFSILAWLVPTLVPKQNHRFRVFCRTVDYDDRLIFMNILCEENRCFLVEPCFCTLLRNRSKLEDVANRRSMSLDHKTLHRRKH